ncbi:1-aminocyclopropane-1-carboxylate deaminase/D-cysteine desulfhydrase [Chitinophaga alhagiae]|uniref:1-aminocyclopropane-1-carboxylate deaminase/D-cysteine desulfhydrase n=1 Tax=Chitinophaga alhagiae TaxID=2203219 RepID=UPI0013002637|nr:pyridoxal-phosphate dependent enzyme [Chitinophaga alhagiae]
MLRLDRLHPLVSGNKWFKLKYNLEAAAGRPIVTFGGAYSNHIAATAAACRMQGIACTGIIRGERPAAPGHTLKHAAEMGMELVFVSREEYRQMTQEGNEEAVWRALGGRPEDTTPPSGHDSSPLQPPAAREGRAIPPANEHRAQLPPYLIPEGGHNALGAKGCEEILSLADIAGYTHIICAVGTGTTLAGLINAAATQQVTGISVLKGALSLQAATQSLLRPGIATPWEILHQFHEGGYGKLSNRLISSMNDFYRQTNIPLDRVYTGKMTLAVQQLLQQGYFPAGCNLLLVHSGGLQGNGSLPPGVLCY